MNTSHQIVLAHQTVLTYARHEDGDVTTMAILTLGHEKPLFKPELRATLSGAITEWVSATDSGKAAWKESAEDFNIGDLGMSLEDPDLMRILSKHGLHPHRLILVDESAVEAFDTVLVNTDKLT